MQIYWKEEVCTGGRSVLVGKGGLYWRGRSVLVGRDGVCTGKKICTFNKYINTGEEEGETGGGLGSIRI